MGRKVAENDPNFLAGLRQIAFETRYDLFQTNFPIEDGFMYYSPAPIRHNINYADLVPRPLTLNIKMSRSSLDDPSPTSPCNN
jgi:hypothetical protein